MPTHIPQEGRVKLDIQESCTTIHVRWLGSCQEGSVIDFGHKGHRAQHICTYVITKLINVVITFYLHRFISIYIVHSVHRKTQVSLHHIILCWLITVLTCKYSTDEAHRVLTKAIFTQISTCRICASFSWKIFLCSTSSTEEVPDLMQLNCTQMRGRRRGKNEIKNRRIVHLGS